MRVECRILRAISILLILVCITACVTQNTKGATPDTTKPLELAQGVYAFIGTGGDITQANQGRIANAGFIVGSHGVLMVDAGVSHVHGQAMLAAIATVTAKPIKAVLLTHAMQEFLFGTTAFQAAGAQLYMHSKSADVMRQRCNNCLKQLNTTLGEVAMKGSRLPVPDVPFTDITGTAAQLSQLIGREVQLLYYDASSGPGDVAVWDTQTRVLFSGAMAECKRMPDTRDAKLAGWVKALDALITLKPQHVVAGHGQLSAAHDASCLTQTRNYLVALDNAVSQLVDQGISLTEASALVPMRDYQGWDQYSAVHGSNVHRQYLEHERRLFDSADNIRK